MGSRQKLLLRVLRRLLARHAGGVPRDQLRSAVILALNQDREAKGEEPIAGPTASAAFRQTLARLVRIVVEEGDRVRLAD